MKPSNEITSSPSSEKGEIVLYQPNESIRLEVRIEDETVWLLGASVKDMGRGLCTVIKLGFCPEEILKRI